jgi:hypothetical protein
MGDSGGGVKRSEYVPKLSNMLWVDSSRVVLLKKPFKPLNDGLFLSSNAVTYRVTLVNNDSKRDLEALGL